MSAVYCSGNMGGHSGIYGKIIISILWRYDIEI